MEQEKQKSFGLWFKNAKSGLKYLNGSFELNGDRYFISVFKNTYKKEDKHPDYNFVVSPADSNIARDKPTNTIKAEVNKELENISLDEEVDLELDDDLGF